MVFIGYRIAVAAALVAATLGMVRQCGSRPQQSGTYLVVETTADGTPAFAVEQSPRQGVLYVGLPFGTALHGGGSRILPASSDPDGGIPHFADVACNPADCNPPGPQTGDPAPLVRVRVRLQNPDEPVHPGGYVVIFEPIGRQ